MTPAIGKRNTIFVRYVRDSNQWVYVTQHSFVKTKGKPADWPEGRDAFDPET